MHASTQQMPGASQHRPQQLPCHLIQAGRSAAEGSGDWLSSATQRDADVINLIKGYLQDPEFQAEVERMAELWDRAEEELLAEQYHQDSMDLEQ